METKERTGVHIRWMIRRDMEEVLAIESEVFPLPWSEQQFVQAMRNRNCIGLVAEHGDRVVGYIVYLLHKRGFEIINLAVDPWFQRQGVGAQLIAKMKGKLPGTNRAWLTADVVETNLDAQKFFAAQGFRATGIVPERFETGEDAYHFRYTQPTD